MSEDATLDEFVEAESDSSEPETDDLARKTVCGIPPQDWTVARLGELVRVVSGNSLPSEYQNDSEAEHPVYKVSDMNASGNAKYVSEAANWLSEGELGEINHTLYPEGTTILPKVGAALLTNKRRMLTEPSSFDNNVMGWVPDEVNPEFLYYVSCMIDMEAVAQKGAVPSISKAIAKSLKLPSPPLSEQRKIATVLYTVDRAIEKTEEIIEQAKSVKSGIVQHVFTEGAEEHSSFRETKSGKIPEKWELVPFEAIIKDTRYGTDTKSNTDGDGYPTLRIPNVVKKRITLNDLKCTPLDEDELDRLELKENDILVIRTNGNPDYVGRCATFSERDEPFVFASYLIRIRVDESRVRPEYIREFLNSRRGRSEMAGWIRSSAGNYNLSVGAIEKFQIPIPSLREQDKIIEQIESGEETIDTNRQYRNHLQRLKCGLMQDLLSGTVRMTDTNIEVPEEITQYG